MDLPLEAFLIPATLLGLLLPAVVITWLVDGQAGIDLLRRLVLQLRASIGWYALALLAVPLTAVVLATIVYGPPNLTSSEWLSAIVSGPIVQSAIGFVTINLWEETARMGFVQVRRWSIEWQAQASQERQCESDQHPTTGRFADRALRAASTAVRRVRHGRWMCHHKSPRCVGSRASDVHRSGLGRTLKLANTGPSRQTSF